MIIMFEKSTIKNNTARADLKLWLYIYTVLQPPAHMAVYKVWHDIKNQGVKLKPPPSEQDWSNTSSTSSPTSSSHLLNELLIIQDHRNRSVLNDQVYKSDSIKTTETGVSWSNRELQEFTNTTVGDDEIDNGV